MKIFRIAKTKYIRDVSGEGARLYGGRWNQPGHKMLYCSPTLSLCLLEILVHLDLKHVDDSFSFFEAELPDEYFSPLIDQASLRADWRHNPPKEFTKNIGSNWIKSNKSTAAIAPSAILPYENNILINPTHDDFRHFKIVRVEELNFDPRLRR